MSLKHIACVCVCAENLFQSMKSKLIPVEETENVIYFTLHNFPILFSHSLQFHRLCTTGNIKLLHESRFSDRKCMACRKFQDQSLMVVSG